MTNTCSRKQKCHKLRKVRHITSEMNFVPQWHISNMNITFQKTIDETNLSPCFWQEGTSTKFDLVFTIFTNFYGWSAQLILSWRNALQPHPFLPLFASVSFLNFIIISYFLLVLSTPAYASDLQAIIVDVTLFRQCA